MPYKRLLTISPCIALFFLLACSPSSNVNVTGVSLSKTSLSLTIGGSETLVATVAPANATNQGVTWTSSDASIASVTSGGLVAGVAAGSAKVTATSSDGGFAATCDVTVSSTVAVTGVTLNKATTTMAVGATETLVATIAPTNATNKTLTWKSSAEAIATVSSSGVVSAIAVGTANITVTTADGGFTATCAVTVQSSIAVTGVTLNKATTTIAVGATETLVATIAPSNATNTAVTWKSGAEAIATVSSSGVVSAVALGTARITVTTADGGFTATCDVTASAQPPAGTPVFNLASGSYDDIQLVTLSSSTSGASIYYTTDGSAPTKSSTLYSKGIMVNAKGTIKAIAVKDGYVDSAVASATYSIIYYDNGANANGQPCYWADGVRTDLAMPADAVGGSATGRTLFDMNGPVYCVGYTYGLGLSSSTYWQPCYWINQTRTALPLPSGAIGGRARSTRLWNGSLYFCGHSTASSGSFPYQACYWKDGTLKILSAGTGSQARHMKKYGSSIYIVGVTGTSSSDVKPCYWKDEVFTALPCGSRTVCYATQTQQFGTDIYILGYALDPSGSINIPCYWKNGAYYELTLPSTVTNTGAETDCILVDGTNVYIGGAIYTTNAGIPCYWKDGVLTMPTLATGTTTGWVFGFLAAEGNVYAFGTCSGSVKSVRCHWLDGALSEDHAYTWNSSGGAINVTIQ